jgi:ATP-dependent DNA helicase RecG
VRTRTCGALFLHSYLRPVKSGLYATSTRLPFADLCRQMAIVDGSDEYLKPRNVGLLFFSPEPERFFPTARGITGSIEGRPFGGPLDHQLRTALRHLQNAVITERVTKVPDRAEAIRVFNYPFAALEEALVNAVYHRGYDEGEGMG